MNGPVRAFEASRALVVVALLASTSSAAEPLPPKGMTRVGPAVYHPLYPSSPAERSVDVPRFWLDVRPVTNGEFLAFVRERPEWRRDRIKAIFADEGYLSHWGSPDGLGTARAAQPVTRVSWFAAKAYCLSRGARLPTERQWEVAALADEKSPDGSQNVAWRDKILTWYGQSAAGRPLDDVGRGKRNYWGAEDLHGLVWEWVLDFGASLVTPDSREKGQDGSLRFCGGSGADARDPTDYAAFMRIAFRSSLEARYTTARLGFRCAKDLEPAP